METAVLLLGSNEGDRLRAIGLADAAVEETVGAVVKRSSLYESEPWGIKEQPSFLNIALAVETGLNPRELLEKILSVEKNLGRTRTGGKWGSRIIDIDILFFGDHIINEQGLVIPHPYIKERRFTLMPLCEIMPGLIHPVHKKTIKELFFECKDELWVREYTAGS
jgi:2-amino-4-hydroxy-6-hydroxymethyldihydropteridine diphosphokinase